MYIPTARDLAFGLVFLMCLENLLTCDNGFSTYEYDATTWCIAVRARVLCSRALRDVADEHYDTDCYRSVIKK